VAETIYIWVIIPFMLKRLATILLLPLLFVSCRDKKADITYLNNELTSINDSLFLKAQIWGEEFRIGFSTGDYSQLKPAREELQSYIERSITRINTLQDVGGSEKFRKTEMEYLRFERDAIVAKMTRFESFDSNTTKEEITTAYNVLMDASRQEQAYMEQLRAVQREYAEKNDLKLERSAISGVD
jgi:hypothetical protein